MNILYINYAGDVAEAYQRLYLLEGKENYYAQRYTVETLLDQSLSGHKVTAITWFAPVGEVEISPNFRSLGFGGNMNLKALKCWILENRPDRIVLRHPDWRILRLTRKLGIATLGVFADSFEMTGIKNRISHMLLARELNFSSLRWVGNHQINAAKSLASIGVKKTKILPYDWEHSLTPDDFKPMINSKIERGQLRLFYAGSLSVSKGVFDLISALPIIASAGIDVHLTICGGGDEAALWHAIQCEKVESRVTVCGLVDHDTILKLMQSSDAVVVPSHHSYPEGLPMTIMESLMTHTPVLASDHPMFIGRVGSRGATSFFAERSPQSIADSAILLCRDIEDYYCRVEAAPCEWFEACLELKWHILINNWIAEPARCDFSKYSLTEINKY